MNGMDGMGWERIWDGIEYEMRWNRMDMMG